MGSKKLPITLKDVSPGSYEKPERKNDLVDGSQYENVDSAIATGAKIASNGVVYVDGESAPKPMS